MKKTFISTPILMDANQSKHFIIKAYADFALGSILSQSTNGEKLHRVAFHSHKFKATKVNYEIHDKERLPIVDLFEH